MIRCGERNGSAVMKKSGISDGTSEADPHDGGGQLELVEGSVPLLAKELDILGRFAIELASAGVAGEQRAIKVIFLVVVSRLLEQIVSLAVKGPSSGGKSFLVETVLRYFPASAYYALTAMSDKALAYDREPLVHRILVIYEAAGMGSDMASYLIRSLLSEGKVAYVTVQKSNGELVPKRVERAGPTGLITTTTATRLHPENETRLLSVTVSDSAAQTKDVLVAQAIGVAAPRDLQPWHELQSWLEAGPTDVDVPYAEALARAVPPVAVRLRRDFPKVLSLIRANALLHRASRQLVAGRIVATLADYRAVRELVSDLIAEEVDQTVSEAVRETVRVVADLTSKGGESTATMVAAALDLDKSAATRRIRTAIDRGYLRNREERSGKPLRLVLGDPLPRDASILPTVDELELLHSCSASRGDRPELRHDATSENEPFDTGSRTAATTQPLWDPEPAATDGKAAPSFYGTPLTSTRICPSCRLFHPVGTTCVGR